MSKLEEREKELLLNFPESLDWEMRYRKIIDMGKSSPPLPDQLKVSENLVKGCQSQVWLVAERKENGHLEFRADSDALIVRGLVQLLLKVYSGAKPEEILTFPADFLKKLSLDRHLSPSRANGLYAMVKQIKYYAAAYKALNQTKA